MENSSTSENTTSAHPLDAKEPLSSKQKATAIGLASFGVALLISGWTGSYLLKRFKPELSVRVLNQHPTTLPPNSTLHPIQLHPESIAETPGTAPLFPKVNWATVRTEWAQAKTALKEFEEKEAGSPMDEALNFNPVVDAMKALGIATALNIAVFGSVGWALSRYYDLQSVSDFSRLLKSIVPDYTNSITSLVPSWIRIRINRPQPDTEEVFADDLSDDPSTEEVFHAISKAAASNTSE